MFEKLDACPSCSHRTFTNYKIVDDHFNTQESFALVSCDNCGLVFTNPRPSIATIDRYYDSPEYLSHHDRSRSLFQFVYRLLRQIALQRKTRILTSLTRKPTTILDFGSGPGYLLDHLQRKAWDVQGVEPSDRARSAAPENVKSSISSSIDAIAGPFEIITAWHVIEDVHDLHETICQLKNRLAPNGYLVIAVPNICSYDCEHYDDKWAGYDTPRHLYHFTQDSLKQLFINHQFTFIRTIPLLFDAYYVSLLSERYTHSRYPWFKALMSGFKSNKLARSTSEFSSIIYIFQK